MSRFMSGWLNSHPEGQTVLDYLKAHGPSTLYQMRSAGLEATRSTMIQLNQWGYIRKAPRSRLKGGASVWMLK